jgi:hypothetical protein
VQVRWDAACWHGCNSTNNTKAKTRNSAAVRASPCPMAAGAASSEENPSNMLVWDGPRRVWLVPGGDTGVCG